MAKDNRPLTEDDLGRFDANRRNVLKLLGTGAGLSVGGFPAGSALASSTASTDTPVSATDDPGVNPRTVSVQLAPGESTTVEKTVTTPEIPPIADIFLLQDETGSFGPALDDDIAQLRALAPEIWDGIAATDTNFTMGVGGFRDYAQDGWGQDSDHVYRRVEDLTGTKSTFLDGVNDLSAPGGAGGDGPEGYLEALHYVADEAHAAIDSNGDSDTTDTVDTPTGQQPSWRSDATRIVLLATDAECHVEGAAGGWPGHQDSLDLGISETVDALNDADITVIGLTPGGPGDIDCVDQIASGTGGSVHAITADSSEIRNAILEGLENLPVEVTPSEDCDDGLSVGFDPATRTVTSGETATFDETISVDSDPPIDGNEDTLTCTVDWLIDGESAGDDFVEEITVEVCADVTVDLIAGQDEVIGTITVSEDGDDIEVTYSLDSGWSMTESHLHLATDCGDIPQTGSGNPKVGRFEFSRDYDPAVRMDTYVVDQAAQGFVDDDELCIAAHAAVVSDSGDEETAWGEGERFTERGNWAMHFSYEVCD